MVSFKEANRLEDIDNFIAFDTERFVNKRNIKLVRVAEEQPLALEGVIAQEDASLPVKNVGKRLAIVLNRGVKVEFGPILKTFLEKQKRIDNGEQGVKQDDIYISLVTQSTTTRSRNGSLTILTPRIMLIDKVNNRREDYNLSNVKTVSEKNSEVPKGGNNHGH